MTQKQHNTIQELDRHITKYICGLDIIRAEIEDEANKPQSAETQDKLFCEHNLIANAIKMMHMHALSMTQIKVME